MTSDELYSKLGVLKAELKEKYSVEQLAIFGSYAKGMQKPDSDIDILVSFQKPIGWSFFDLKDYLESQLGKRVDLVTPNALKDLIKQNILDEAHYL